MATRVGTYRLYAIGKFLVGVSVVLEGAGFPEHTIFDRYIKTWIFQDSEASKNKARYLKDKPAQTVLPTYRLIETQIPSRLCQTVGL